MYLQGRYSQLIDPKNNLLHVPFFLHATVAGHARLQLFMSLLSSFGCEKLPKKEGRGFALLTFQGVGSKGEFVPPLKSFQTLQLHCIVFLHVIDPKSKLIDYIEQCASLYSFFFHVTDLQCTRQPPKSVLCEYFILQWLRTNRWYYNNPEEVSRSVEPYHMHMFINLNLILSFLFHAASCVFTFHCN